MIAREEFKKLLGRWTTGVTIAPTSSTYAAIRSTFRPGPDGLGAE